MKLRREYILTTQELDIYGTAPAIYWTLNNDYEKHLYKTIHRHVSNQAHQEIHRITLLYPYIAIML